MIQLLVWPGHPNLANLKLSGTEWIDNRIGLIAVNLHCYTEEARVNKVWIWLSPLLIISWTILKPRTCLSKLIVLSRKGTYIASLGSSFPRRLWVISTQLWNGIRYFFFASLTSSSYRSIIFERMKLFVRQVHSFPIKVHNAPVSGILSVFHYSWYIWADTFPHLHKLRDFHLAGLVW